MSRQSLDLRRWFDRMQPQTLHIATWLLYINGFFALVALVDGTGWIGFAVDDRGSLGVLIAILVIVAFSGGGFLMANDRRLGYRLAVIAAFSPFLLRIWLTWSWSGISLLDRITGSDFVGFIFDVALCALLLHPHSRDHQRLWFS